MSIKTNFEFPRGENPNDALKQGQRLAQDLSKNFKAISKALGISTTNNFVSGINGVEFSSAYSITCASGTTNSVAVTFTHSFGTVPTGFILTDITSSNTAGLTNPVLTRDSWTTTQVVIRLSILNVDTFSTKTQSGNFKILLLR
jgi:hypothetical protein